MAAQATGPGSDSLAVHDIEPVTTIGQSDPVTNVTNKKPQQSIIPESYDLGAGDEDPTTDELHGYNALRRVSAPIPWVVYTVAFVELCERFSYYGTQVLCKIPQPHTSQIKNDSNIALQTLTSSTMHFPFLPRMALPDRTTQLELVALPPRGYPVL